jgi:O-acetyl-ADP-ribose deacetylase (regulator of RNase III)
MGKVSLIKGDITHLRVDAIVNAANVSLLGGGGVDGAIHRAAGRELLEECKTLGGCPTGEARITRGYNLPARHVIHTVGPIWRGGTRDEALLLRRAYLSSLQLASDKKLATIAFPNISTGVYGFPKRAAAEIAVRAVQEFIGGNEYPQKVIFVCFDDENYSIYGELLKALNCFEPDRF